ncbi:MAG: hypothetical protein IT539_17190 [Bradyrhizobiaceae bacterium]|nr:hypothetical protein [Bradyrhizobiaceae bacterium]
MQILGRQRNAMLAFLVVGLLIGALAGYLTRPESAEIRIGPVQIEVTGKGIARDSGGELTSSQVQHIALITLIGGIIGLGFGYAAERGKLKG